MWRGPWRQGRHPHGRRNGHICPTRRAREPRRQRSAGGRPEARRPPADGGQGLPGLLLSLLGSHQGGHRAGTAQYDAAPADYAYLFEDSGCGFVVYSGGPPRKSTALEQVFVKAGTADDFLGDLAKASDKLEARLAEPNDDCFWLYSSGSTGRPKGAVHLQRDMVVTSGSMACARSACARTTSATRRASSSSPTVSATP